MKTIFTTLLSFVLSACLFGQITYNGCSNLITAGPSPYTLSQTGTTNDGGTIRNSYAGPPVSCSAGVCNFTMIWNIGAQRWELSLPGIGPLHYNTSASVPNPPDLTLGTWVNDQGCSTISTLSGDIQSTVVLPVELLSFSGEINSKFINLQWQTASEINNEKFEIEFSRSGKEFKKAGEIKGNGTSMEQKDYKFDIQNPQNGLNYFRLKQIDFDGHFEYSKVIIIKFRDSNRTVGDFYPNPTSSGLVNIDYTSEITKDIDVSVFDVAGKLVVNQNYSVLSGSNNLVLNLSEIEKGIYFVRFGDIKSSTYRKLLIE